MPMETNSIGTRVFYGARRRPESNGGVIGGVGAEKQITVQTSGTAGEVSIMPYWPNAKWIGPLAPHTVPTGLTVGLYKVDSKGALSVLVADAAFAAAVFTTASTGIDAQAAGELAADEFGLVLRFTGASVAGLITFEVGVNVVTPKTLPATR